LTEIRSAAAQAGIVDSELLIFEAAKAFHNAQTQLRLDAEWAALVRPAYDQLSERSLAILNHLYGLNSTVIQRGLR
jgi:hypothetical protein